MNKKERKTKKNSWHATSSTAEPQRPLSGLAGRRRSRRPRREVCDRRCPRPAPPLRASGSGAGTVVAATVADAGIGSIELREVLENIHLSMAALMQEQQNGLDKLTALSFG